MALASWLPDKGAILQYIRSKTNWESTLGMAGLAALEDIPPPTTACSQGKTTLNEDPIRVRSKTHTHGVVSQQIYFQATE